MKTIESALQAGSDQLSLADIESARVDAEWLMEHVTGLKRLELTLYRQRELSPEEEAAFSRLITSRARRIPLQHLIGDVPFLGHRIKVSDAALIPRPETERLAEMAIEALVRRGTGRAVQVLDLGTGTGCLPVALGLALPQAQIWGLDISPTALSLAAENIRSHGLADRVKLVESNLFQQLRADQRFDLIVSNPPYIPSEEISNLQPEVRDYDPRNALDGGLDGLDFYRVIADEGKPFLRPGGWVLMEFGDGQLRALKDIFESRGWRFIASHRDYADVQRMVSFE